MLADELVKAWIWHRSGGTDNHSMLLDLRTKFPELTGKVAENALVAADITANKNKVPYDERSAFQTSGLRLGTAAMTTRGCKGRYDVYSVLTLLMRVFVRPQRTSRLLSVYVRK